jgi:MFS family permease
MGAVIAAVGPVFGGWLIDVVGWRSIFLINLPPATGAIVLALMFVRDPRREKNAPPLDLLGSLFATCTLGTITWGLTIGSGHEGWTPTAVLLVSAGIILMLSFLLIEKSKGKIAMMPSALFESSSFIGLTVLTFLLYGGLGGPARARSLPTNSGCRLFGRRSRRRAAAVRARGGVSLACHG